MDEPVKNLKDIIYYGDLYDRFTVDKCRRWEKKEAPENRTEIKEKTKKLKIDKIKKEFIVNVVIPTALYFIKGDRYAQKAETIREWMAQDQAKDDLLASARPPEGIQCLTCKSALIPTFRDLQSGWPDKKDRVLFMYDCPNGCLPHRAFFDDGEERRPTPYLCSKCNNEANKKYKRNGNIITTIYTCPKCGHKEKDILDLDEKPEPEKIDPDFAKDRERFCLSEKEGQEYIEAAARLKNVSKLIEESKEKEKIQKELAGIKKLSVAGLGDLLSPLLEKEGYIKLEFSKPEIDRDVIIQFNIQDGKSDREEYDSKFRLQKIIKSALEKTNWRLMSEGVYYRLGILSGRLRGYENDEDLIKLVNK